MGFGRGSVGVVGETALPVLAVGGGVEWVAGAEPALGEEVGGGVEAGHSVWVSEGVLDGVRHRLGEVGGRVVV